MIKDKVAIGIIGGSGLYDLNDTEELAVLDFHTPWGKPSDKIKVVSMKGHKFAFLPRHSQGHRLLPGEVPYCANIAAMRHIGVRQIFAFSAVGSLKEELKPLDFVLPDQVIDRTKNREHSYFGNGIAAHVGFADPFCAKNAKLINLAATQAGIKLHCQETAICMEGPAFSSRAESHLYRSWGAGVINMTVLPEAKLAREAGICYNVICMVTDYDCWKTDEEAVTTQSVVQTLQANAINARRLLQEIIQQSKQESCSCQQAIESSVITHPSARSREALEKMQWLYPEQKW